jgi:hypothetical protein
VTTKGVKIKTLSFYETKPLFGRTLVVAEGDADPGIPRAGTYALSENHTSICKPLSRTSAIHLKLIDFVRTDCLGLTAPATLPAGAPDRHSPPEMPPWPLSPVTVRSKRGRLKLAGFIVAGFAVSILIVCLCLAGSVNKPNPHSRPPTRYQVADMTYSTCVELMESAYKSGNWADVEHRMLEKHVVWSGFVDSSSPPGYVIRPTRQRLQHDRHLAYVTLLHPTNHPAYQSGELITVSGIISKIDKDGIELMAGDVLE